MVYPHVLCVKMFARAAAILADREVCVGANVIATSTGRGR